jgi:hypothetical protein
MSVKGRLGRGNQEEESGEGRKTGGIKMIKVLINTHTHIYIYVHVYIYIHVEVE